jgi:hypothetical protein
VTFRNRKDHKVKNLEKAEEAFLAKAEEAPPIPDIVPNSGPQRLTPDHHRKYGYVGFTLRLNEEQIEKIRRIAAKEDRSMQKVAVRLLMEAVDRELSQ